MTMPISNTSSGAFPIEVTQDNVQFLVKIPASLKERASMIPGRRWNPQIKRWVYPKTTACYEALKEQFKRDAAIFDIRKPPSKRLPTPAPQELESDPGMEEWREPTEKDSNLQEKFWGIEEQIASVLRFVQDINHNTKHLLQKQTVVDRPNGEERDTPSEAQPTSLSFTDREDLQVLETTLKHLAFATAGQDASFTKWIANQQPLLSPHRFVSETHEKLKSELANILGIQDHRPENFNRLIGKCKEQELLSTEHRLNVPQVLYAMNQHRNRFSHAENFPDSEQLSRSIIYLLNLALIWPHVASEPVDEEEHES